MRMNIECFPIGCFGKLPFYKEYIQNNIHEPEAQLLVKWMDEGTDYSNRFSGSTKDFSNTHYQLIFCPKTGDNFLIGHLRVSSDSLRNYPFAIFGLCNFTGFRGQFSLLPHLCIRFWDALSHFLYGEFTSLQSFNARLRELLIPIPHGQSEDRENLLSMTISTKATVLWESLFNTADDPRKFHLLKNLWTVLSPHRTSASQEIQVALCIPLSSGVIPLTVQLFFWLEIISRMLKKIDITPSLFIPEQMADNDVQNLYVFFREPQPSDYRDIMGAHKQSEKINDLSGDWGVLETMAPFPLKAQNHLESKEATLQQIIDSCGIE